MAPSYFCTTMVPRSVFPGRSPIRISRPTGRKPGPRNCSSYWSAAMGPSSADHQFVLHRRDRGEREFPIEAGGNGCQHPGGSGQPEPDSLILKRAAPGVGNPARDADRAGRGWGCGCLSAGGEPCHCQSDHTECRHTPLRIAPRGAGGYAPLGQYASASSSNSRGCTRRKRSSRLERLARSRVISSLGTSAVARWSWPRSTR